jgi:hypothetical protein
MAFWVAYFVRTRIDAIQFVNESIYLKKNPIFLANAGPFLPMRGDKSNNRHMMRVHPPSAVLDMTIGPMIMECTKVGV